MKDKDLKVLENIRRVKVPPYLYDRIEARIHTDRQEKIPIGRAILAGFALALLLFFNILIIGRYTDSPDYHSSLRSVAEQMYLSPTNHLYHE